MSSVLMSRLREVNDNPLIRCVDMLLASTLCIAPLFMGGRHPVGHLVLVSIICLAGAFWLLHQALTVEPVARRSGAEILLILAVMFVGMQLCPLPDGVLKTLSPGLAEMFPLWTSSGTIPGLTEWSTLSVAPAESRGGFSMLAAYCLLFFLLVQRLRTLGDVERALRLIALALGLLSIIGLAQLLFGNGKFLWVYEHPFRDTSDAVKGPFHNRNHFAHFLALGIGSLIWWVWRTAQTAAGSTRQSRSWGSDSQGSQQRAAVPFLVVLVGVTLLAGALSLSRGGIVALLIAAGVCLAIYLSKSLIGRRSLVAVAGVVLFGAVGVTVYGLDALQARVETVSEAENLADLSQGRQEIWTAVGKAIPDFLYVGSGAGTHRYVYPRYFRGDQRVEYSHAENGYLQILLETGAIGFTLLIVMMGLCVFWSFRAWRTGTSDRQRACVGAVAGGLVASTAHALVDFAWYVPACMTLTVFLMACIWRLSLRDDDTGEESRIRMPRPAWGVAAGAFMGISFLLIQPLTGPALASGSWDRVHKATLAAGNVDLEPHYETLDQRLTDLGKVVQVDPANARAHLNLASLLRQKFELEQGKSSIPMPLNQIRDAVANASFDSQEALDQWLSRVLGERRDYLDRSTKHAYRALELCPMQGEACVFLAELNFLKEVDREHESALIRQALLTRPVSPPVLLAAGRDALLVGDQEAGLRHFRKAFKQGPPYQAYVMRLFLRQDAEFFLENFPLDSGAMKMLRNHYASVGNAEQSRILGVRIANQQVKKASQLTGEAAAEAWTEARDTFRSLDQHSNALQAARNAIASAPGDYRLRRDLVNLLLEQQKYKEAVPLLEWCLEKYPNNKKLRESLMAARAEIRQASAEIPEESSRGKITRQ